MSHDVDIPSADLHRSHMPSKMSSRQVQDYISLLASKVGQLGEHYVARQIGWAVSELERLEGRA